MVLSPVVTSFKAHANSSLPHPVPVHQPSATFLPADAHHECSHISSHIALSWNSPVSANIILDLSHSRIKADQLSNLDTLPIFNHLHAAPFDPQFAVQDDVFLCFLLSSNAASSSRVPFLPKSLVPLVLRTCHDHPLSKHFGI